MHDVSKPKEISHLLENYEKESRIRMKWVEKHASQFENAATLNREEKNYTKEDITKATIEFGLAATTRDHIAAARFKNTYRIPDYKLAKFREKSIQIPLMEPSADFKDIAEIGRKEYLKKRSLLKPEDKYNFVLCSSWRYGWKLNESMVKYCGSEHGKVNHVMNYLRSRVGPQRDPDHYQTPNLIEKVYDAL